ncbi:hypothetical protein VSU16_04560 [Cetobacterium somerae]|uniref:hypothetical protein n=1 Tax=Cetobacterium somerae TaxID=188913 RepID=UPI002E7B272A|nr:hypothetical protein [Cetobacterium somerae]WVJ02016.1 hypothetical protein VSU16_04560 [Cetobacterium somerae]
MKILKRGDVMVLREIVAGKIKLYEEMMEREKNPEKKAVWHFVISDLKGELD